MNWRILYLGSLNSCNYSCSYCPFADSKSSRAEITKDATDLTGFCSWIENQPLENDLSILFAPRGEALIWPYYQTALVRLSHQPHVSTLVAQTNLSGSSAWASDADRSTLVLWCTFHPEEVAIDVFLAKLDHLDQIGIPYSVGVVGKKDAVDEIQQLRDRLPKDRYLWINAYKDVANYYGASEVGLFNKIDPHFSLNLKDYPSRGKPCWAGESSFSIEGDGSVFRCNLIRQKIGNIYQQTLVSMATRKSCSRDLCDCYIGYINLKNLDMGAIYGERILARIPIEE